MKKTVTTRYDVAEHLRTPEEMAAYLEAGLEAALGLKLHAEAVPIQNHAQQAAPPDPATRRG